MKTIREWLEELPEPYRTQALENAEMNDQENGANCLDHVKAENSIQAIYKGFLWSNTQQGIDYWIDFKDSLL